MAKKSTTSPAAAQPQSGPEITKSFSAGMVKDLTDVFLGEGVWSNARNAITNTHGGEAGTLSNEPSNELLTLAPFTVIGISHHSDTKWVVFSTDDLTSEIGLIDERLRTYEKVVRSEELNFKRSNLITAIVKGEYDSTHTAYWQDGENPDRVMNLTRVPYRTTGVNLSPDPSCYIPEYTDELDIDEILLHPKLTLPTLLLEKNPGGGQLPAGSYQAFVAYSVKNNRVTDYFTPSQAVSLWSHSGGGGALKLTLENLDDEFDQFELVIVSITNGQTQAKRVGHYSIRQNVIVLDQIQQSLPNVDVSVLPLKQPIYHKSDGMFELNGYLIRTGVSTRPDFNYQPLANQIGVNWVAVSYPADYYANSGVNVGTMRDEVYPYFIRWVYNTGLKGASYHIPGRAPTTADREAVTGSNVLPTETERWQSEDTSTSTALSPTITRPDGGVVTHRGQMQFWESSEFYPREQPLVWGSLCGKKIRHHKFPTNEKAPHFSNLGKTISVLGVEFTGIAHPIDENGELIRDIVGYEILRGSREGNKSVIAKGLLTNLVEYTIPNSTTKGLYDNYPYNDLRPDKFLVNRDTVFDGSSDPDDNAVPITGFQNTQFGFHSPDTTFNKPFLSGAYLQLYQEHKGTVSGNFDYVDKHPKEKLITNHAFNQALLVAMGITVLNSIGSGNMYTELEPSALGFSVGTAGWARQGGMATAIPDAIANCVMSPATTISGVAVMLAGMGVFGGQGMDQALDIIYKMSPARQYALQYNSHGFYNEALPIGVNNRRREIAAGDVRYIGAHVQDFTATHRINNFSRNPFVALKTTRVISNPTTQDTTRQRVQDKGIWKNPTREFTSTTSSYYGALKLKYDNQYGQLDSITQIPTHSGVHLSPGDKTLLTSPVIFGGDTYINRYAEKNPYLYFNKWLKGDVPDSTEYDYRLGLNGPRPRYWANFEKFDVGDLSLDIKFDFGGYDDDDIDNDDGFDVGPFHIEVGRPSKLHYLDREGAENNGSYTINYAYIYLFNNGVRDYFVESEMNLAFRDHEESSGGRHYSPYEPYSDLKTLFRSDLIDRPELLKYDNSLSVSKLYYNFATWGSLVGPDFDPLNQASRFTYFRDRAIYSLQHQAGLRRDNFKVFLANNYKDFHGTINQIKALDATGALILFENSEPVQFSGVDQLKTTGGTKITIGDAGLFQQGMQGVVNADDSLEYGSCQSRRAAVNTPQGLFWISQKTGKIMQYAGGGSAQSITEAGMSRWFTENLPSKLLHQFPDFVDCDNPVSGIGCQTVYDPMYQLLYFSKRDFELRPSALELVSYDPLTGFGIVDENNPENVLPVTLGDPRYFEDCSWTTSYDPQGLDGKPGWVSHHDWIPGLTMASYQHFITIKERGFYRHNTSWSSFGNFYGEDFPFEVELPINSGGETVVLRSVQYQLECLRYSEQGRNAFHLLDENFDRAMIYNSEQNSGWLQLMPKTKGNPLADQKYPKRLGSVQQILFSKEEQKYRFNQFWDQTKDRGEFSGKLVPMFSHPGNGYVQQLNPTYFDYEKPVQQRKKFRHYGNRLILRKNVAGPVNLILRLLTTKMSLSTR